MQNLEFMELKKYKLGNCFQMAENGLVVKQTKEAKGMPITRIETLSNDCFNRDRLGYGNIFDEKKISHYILDDKDLIISHINSRTFLGRTVLYRKRNNEKIIHGMNVLRVKTNPNILDPIFAFYLFRTKLFKRHIDNIRKDAINQSSFALSDLKNIELYIPTVKEQNEIANALQLLDAKIDLNRQINDNLEAMAKQLYDYWFVQFDFPNEEGKPYKASGGAMVWNDKLKREIPEGWYAENICKIGNILSGGTPSKAVDEYWNNGTIPFFGPTDCNGSVFQIKTADHITQKGLEHCASSLFEEGIVIITARGSIGKLVIVGTPMAMNQSCYALQSKEGEYEYLYFLTTQLIDCLKAKGSGSVFKSIIASDIEHSALCIATDNVVSDFCKKVKPMFEKLKANTIEIAELTKQRDELLPLLMNGQATVNYHLSDD